MVDNQQQEGSKPNQLVSLQSLIPAGWGDMGGNSEYLTFLPQQTREERLFVYRVLNEQGRSIKELLNTPIEVCNVLCSKAEFEDKETHELVQTIVTRLILVDGSWAETHSSGVWKNIGQLCQLYGPPPWQPPVKVMPLSQSLNGGRNWYVLKLIVESQAKGGKQK